MTTIISNNEGQWIELESAGLNKYRVICDNIREDGDPIVDRTELAIRDIDGLEILERVDYVGIYHARWKGVELDFRDQENRKIFGSCRLVLEAFRQGIITNACVGDE